MPKHHQQLSPNGSNSSHTSEPLPDLIDTTALARHLGVEVRHVRRLVHERRIPFLKWGHLVRFDPRQVNAWLETCRVEPHRPQR